MTQGTGLTFALQKASSASSETEAAAEPQISITALLEALSPQQQNDYLQQLYMTTEYSTRPAVSVIEVSATDTTAIVKQKTGPITTTTANQVVPPPVSVAARPMTNILDANNSNTRAAVAVSKRSSMPKRPAPAPQPKAPAPAVPLPAQQVAAKKSFSALYFPPAYTNDQQVMNPVFQAAIRRDEELQRKEALAKKTMLAKMPAPKPKTKSASPAKVAAAIQPKAPRRQPQVNDSEGRGVTMRPSGKWQAQMYFAGKSRYIGVFDSREKAALGYEIARLKLKSAKFATLGEIEAQVTLARKAAFQGVNDQFGKRKNGMTGNCSSSPQAVGTSSEEGSLW